MALISTFGADFSSFYGAVQKADTALQGFQQRSDAVGGTLNKMVNQFSGEKVVADAVLMTEAIERLGGTATLTEKQLQRVGSTLAEAIPKMQAAGMAVPSNMQAIAKETATADSSLGALLGTAGKLAGVFGVGFGAMQAVSFLKGVVESSAAAADQLTRLSDQTDIAIGDLQRMQGVSTATGVDLGSLTQAVSYLQAHMDDAGFDKKISDMGVSFSQLRAAQPYEQLQLIAEAVGGITDPVQRADAAVALFGRNGASILPALRANWKELGDAVQQSGDDQVRALDDAADAYARFKQNVSNSMTGALGTIVMAGQQLTSETASWVEWAQIIGALATGSVPRLGASIKDLTADRAAALVQTRNLAAAEKEMVAIRKDLVPPKLAPADLPAALRYAQLLDQLTADTRELTAVEKARVDQARALGQSNAEIAKGLDVSVQSVDRYTDATDKATAASKKFAEELANDQKRALAEQVKAIDAVTKAMTDADAQRAALTQTDTERKIAAIHAWADQQRDVVKGVEGDWSGYYEWIAAEEQRRIDESKINWDTVRDAQVASLQDAADRAQATYDQLRTLDGSVTAEAVANAKTRADAARAALDAAVHPEAVAAAKAMAEANKANEDQLNAMYAAWSRNADAAGTFGSSATAAAQATTAANADLHSGVQAIEFAYNAAGNVGVASMQKASDAAEAAMQAWKNAGWSMFTTSKGELAGLQGALDPRTPEQLRATAYGMTHPQADMYAAAGFPRGQYISGFMPSAQSQADALLKKADSIEAYNQQTALAAQQQAAFFAAQKQPWGNTYNVNVTGYANGDAIANALAGSLQSKGLSW